MGKFIDLTGMKFGRLTVIERAENKNKKICWLCECDCGNEKIIRGADLKNGKTTSCGCFSKEKTKQLNEEQWKNENFRKMQSERVKQMWENENFRKMQSERMKKLNEEQWKNNEFRQRHSNRMKNMWQDEDFRQIQNEKQKRLWENDEFRQRHSEKMLKMWENDEFRQKQSEKAEQQWQDESFRQMQIEVGKQKAGSKNPNYKGGITTISRHLRNLHEQWHEDCKRQANYTCQLTGQNGGQLHTHHLKAFSTIVIEAHNLHNIQIKDQVKDYTQEELKLLEEYVGSWHKDNSNAVVLSEDAHNLFHKLYGKGNNTPEQFEEFKERYLAEEFKEILN